MLGGCRKQVPGACKSWEREFSVESSGQSSGNTKVSWESVLFTQWPVRAPLQEKMLMEIKTLHWYEKTNWIFRISYLHIYISTIAYICYAAFDSNNNRGNKTNAWEACPLVDCVRVADKVVAADGLMCSWEIVVNVTIFQLVLSILSVH